ncbi:MAG: hypothetical protein NZT92_02320 [Abditibacteriales bacterium]|nr:hypothetical protein [Abditibacteriales bacterium]
MIGGVKETALTDLQRLIQNYPKSLYRRHALFALAGGVNEVVSNVTIPLYERIAQSADDFQFMDRVLLSLLQHYTQQREFDKCRALGERLRKLAYVSPFYQSQMKRELLFLEDKRLDQDVTYEFPQPTPLADVLAYISQQTGVPLRVPADLGQRNFSSVRQTKTVREFMKCLSSARRSGLRRTLVTV